MPTSHSGAKVISPEAMRRESSESEHYSAEVLDQDERSLDYRAVRAQADQEDIALVRLAARKLAVALREVHVLLGRDRAAWKSDALARCSAKGWVMVQGHDAGAVQTFRVTPEGYRAAGLRVPPFGV